MSAFGGLILTNRGRALQAKAQAGAQLQFTKIRVGDGQLGSQFIPDLTNMINTIKTLDISKLKALTDGKAVIGCVLSNSGLTAGFYWRELGVFAQDPDLGEILYCYGNAGTQAEYIPADGGADLVEKQIDVITLVGNAASVSAIIEQSMIYASAQDLKEHVEDTDTHITPLEREAWNAKETPAGAQAKADAAAAVVQDNLDIHKADYVRQPGYGVATGVNALTVTLNPAPTAYVDGMALSFKNTNQNTGAVTLNVNGLGAKTVVKLNGNALVSGNLKAGSIYTVRYNASTGNFILQGEGGEYGTAGAPQVLAGYTIGTENGIVAGTMPNNGNQTTTLQIAGAGKPTKTISAGYTTGGTITAELATSLASSILEGVTIGGVAGTAKKLTSEKRWASGYTYALVNQGSKFFNISGSETSKTFWPIAVTGLTFKPSIILVYRETTNSNDPQCIYWDKFKVNDIPFLFVPLNYDTLRVDGSRIYINETGFRVPTNIYTTDNPLWWIAIE